MKFKPADSHYLIGLFHKFFSTSREEIGEDNAQFLEQAALCNHGYSIIKGV
jgi:hypothetical protein